LTSTGNVVIGVFHTLSAGKAGQFVPGNVGAATRGDTVVEGPRDLGVAPETTGASSVSPATIAATPTTAQRGPRCPVRVIQPVYFSFTIRPESLSNSCSSSTRSVRKSWNPAFVEWMDVAL
jgi:hypothetical protein